MAHASAFRLSASRYLSYRLSCTSTRLEAQQSCPELKLSNQLSPRLDTIKAIYVQRAGNYEVSTHKIPMAVQLAASSTSADSHTTIGLFPPNSSVTFFKLLSAAAIEILRPVTTEPVKAILSTSMCRAIASPVVAPSPGTMLSTPAGKPASLARSHSIKAVRGVSSEGFMTIVQPAARAGAIFQAAIRRGY